MEGVSAEIAHHQPGGTANSIASTVAHTITSVDAIVNVMLKGEMPLAMSEETGLSEPPPTGDKMFDWHEWGLHLTVDLPVFHTYAGKVMAAADQYLEDLTDNGLERKIPSPAGGETTVFGMLNIALSNISWHTGEIATLKGIQGLKGYAF